MSENTPRKLITRGIPTKILNFDGPSFSLQITQGELDTGLAINMALEKRTKTRHDNFKETQVEKSLKETRLPIAEKGKKHISEASSVKGKEVEKSKNSDTLEVKGITLEFALVTGLKCVGNDADFEFNEKVPNRLIETYFGGANLFKKKDLMECFDDKNWGHDNDVDALKITVLYFIHTFIFSSEKNSTTIPSLNFDLVESGRYSEYPWGLKAFESLTKSISKKMDAQKKYYRIAGMPLAMQIIYKDIYPTDIELAVIQIPPVGVAVENSPTPTHSNKSAEDSDDFSPTPDLPCKKKYVVSVGPSSSPPHKKRKEQIIHPSNTENQSKIPYVGVSEIAQNVLHHNQLEDSKNDEVSSLRKNLNTFKENSGGNTTSELPCNIPPTGQESVSTDFYVSQFELDDKFLPTQIPETRIVIHNNAKKGESTPVPSHRNRRPSRWYSLPYESNFDSTVKLTPIFEKRHPFEDDSITGPHPTLIIQEYDKWVRDGLLARHEQKSNLEEHYKKNKSTLQIPLDFWVDQVNSKNWFYLLSFDGKLWDDNTRSAEIFDRYADTDSNANVAKEEDVVCEYIRGYRLLANVPWHTVDNVLIPVNLKDKLHWILVVVSFKERCIKVYDSYRSAAYTDKSHTDPFEVVFISNLPQQKVGSMDGGVHVAAYAEFLSTLGKIPQTTFNSNLLRQRYGPLLWDYAMRKIDADAISVNEAPSKITRQITESDSKLQIVLE
ncbi:uncharacterized protein LOC142178461 [Nicotiana tabacum]|uniref:Uncharacterized protein LOC142178461 n=1 Tax=Nicotiana tabacum TaxID=4097 RepID=A0AC58U3R6_TOBAC